VVRMHSYFPKLCPPACGMEINFRRIKNNPRISVLTSSEVTGISGNKENLQVTIKSEPAYVNAYCTACGDCIEVCPETRPDAFNHSFGSTRAIYLPYAQAFPRKFVIDEAYCKGSSCSKCVASCMYDAINLNAERKEEIVEAHSVIIATGWKNFNASNIPALAYTESKDVVTNVEFELLSRSGPGEGKLQRPSDKKEPGSIAFVQCAGSRDRNNLPYCSAVCCSASLKHALNVLESNPGAKVTIFYIDLRVTGRNEDFLRKVESKENIRLIKGKVGSIAVSRDNRDFS
ncbi:heterodisulfide reductase subunit A, partial [Bacteroidota bacterium]